MSKSIKLLDQIIEKAEIDDLEFKKEMVRTHKSSLSVGEGWTLFHLKILKETLTEELNGKN